MLPVTLYANATGCHKIKDDDEQNREVELIMKMNDYETSFNVWVHAFKICF
jgi:hypothetical protein